MDNLREQKKAVEARMIDLDKKIESIQSRKLDLEGSLPGLRTAVSRAEAEKKESLLHVAHDPGAEGGLRRSRKGHQEATNRLAEALELLAAFDDALTQTKTQKSEQAAVLEKIKADFFRGLYQREKDELVAEVGPRVFRLYSLLAGFQSYVNEVGFFSDLFHDVLLVETREFKEFREEILSKG